MISSCGFSKHTCTCILHNAISCITNLEGFITKTLGVEGGGGGGGGVRSLNEVLTFTGFKSGQFTVHCMYLAMLSACHNNTRAYMCWVAMATHSNPIPSSCSFSPKKHKIFLG